MHKFIIERDIPEIGSADQETLSGAAAKSNEVLNAMQAEKKKIQWEQSYVADNKTFCVYLAQNESLISEHSERSGFPASLVTRVENVIDPTTAKT